jgi:hypothetical protein
MLLITTEIAVTATGTLPIILILARAKKLLPGIMKIYLPCTLLLGYCAKRDRSSIQFSHNWGHQIIREATPT